MKEYIIIDVKFPKRWLEISFHSISRNSYSSRRNLRTFAEAKFSDFFFFLIFQKLKQKNKFQMKMKNLTEKKLKFKIYKPSRYKKSSEFGKSNFGLDFRHNLFKIYFCNFFFFLHFPAGIWKGWITIVFIFLCWKNEGINNVVGRLFIK